jgi:adenylate kinase family enzyme
MRRVLVIGISGAGKSTFSQALATKTGLPLIHLDKEFWRPGWVQTPRQEWRARVSELAARERWIMDGNYDSSLDLRLPRADTVL